MFIFQIHFSLTSNLKIKILNVLRLKLCAPGLKNKYCTQKLIVTKVFILMSELTQQDGLLIHSANELMLMLHGMTLLFTCQSFHNSYRFSEGTWDFVAT